MRDLQSVIDVDAHVPLTNIARVVRVKLEEESLVDLPPEPSCVIEAVCSHCGKSCLSLLLYLHR